MEEVLLDLYNEAKSKGYTKSLDEFTNVLYTNEDVYNDMFEYVQSKGYNKSSDDFSQLIGKKKDFSVSPLGDTDSKFPTSTLDEEPGVPKGEGLKKLKANTKSIISGLARLPVSLRELDVAIRQSLDPEFKKKIGELTVEERENILSSTPGVAVTGELPTPLIGVDEEGKEVSRYYGGSQAIKFSQKLQEEADVINESLTQFETTIGQDLFSIENSQRGFARLVDEVVGAIPSMVLAMSPGGLYAIGGSTASQKSRRLQEQGEDLTLSRYANALGTGVAEAYFEKFTKGLGNSSFRVLREVFKEGGESKVKETAKSILYNLGKGFNIEATSESLTDASERALDLVLAGDEKAFENFWLEIADTYLVGGAAGAPLRTVGPGVRLLKQQAQIKNLENKVKESPFSDLTTVFKPTEGDFTVDISKLPIVEAPNSELFLKETLKRQVKKGKLTPLEEQEILDNYYTAQNVNSQLKGIDLSEADKSKAAALLQEQITLDEFIKDKPTALVKKQNDRIAEINSELEKISEGQIGVVTEQVATREEAVKALFEEGVESPTEEQVLSKLDEIIQKSAPVTKVLEAPRKKPVTEVVLDEDLDFVPPKELPLQKVLRKDDVIRKKIQDEKTLPGERKKAVLDLIGKLQPKGEVFALRARTLIKDVAKLNFNNTKKVNEFIKKIDKTFDDSALKQDLKDANTLKKSIAETITSPVTQKTVNPELVTSAKQFLNIDPTSVEDLTKYIEFANKVKSGLKKTTKRKGLIKPSAPFVIEVIDAYSSEEIKKIESRLQELEDETYRALIGETETTIPLNELRSLLYPELELTPEQKQQEIEKQETQVRASLKKGFDNLGGVINQILETGVDPFSNEVINLNKNQRDLVDNFLKIDPNKLTTLEAGLALDALTNFATNGSTASMQGILSEYEGNLNREKNIEEGVVAAGRIPIINELTDKWIESFGSLSALTESIFLNPEYKTLFSNDSSLQDVQNNFNKAETEVNKIIDDYKTKYPNVRQANKQDFNTEENITERGMFAFLRRSIVGTARQQQEEFNRRKKLVENDIIAFEKSDDSSQKTIGELYRKVYDKIAKDSNNPSEIESKVDPLNLEAVNWITDKWTDIKPLLDEVALNVYNIDLGTDPNYTTDSFVKRITEDVPDLDAPISSELGYNYNRKIYDKESRVFKPTTKPKVLLDRFINLDFDNVQLNSMRKALTDVYSAANIRKLKGYLESNDLKKIIPDDGQRKIFINRVKKYIQQKRGVAPKSQNIKNIEAITNFAVGFGTQKVLGGVTMFPKQLTPLVNTFVNAGGITTNNAIEAFITNKDVREFIKNSGNPIANRGIGSTVVIDKISDKLDKKANSLPSKWLNDLNNINNKWLEVFLLSGDKAAANISFVAYYASEMAKKGIDVFAEGYDWTQPIDREAGNAAQQLVDRNQYVSDTAAQGDLFDTNNVFSRALMKMVMPFASFILNQKIKNYIDVGTFFNKDASLESKMKSLKSLQATLAENFTFAGMGVMISTGLFALTASLLGVDDEEERKKFENRIKGRAGNLVTDLLSPAPVVDPAIISGVNLILKNIEKGEDPFQFFEDNYSTFWEKLGVFTISGEAAFNMAKLSNIASTGKIGDYTLTPSEKEAAKLTTVLSVLVNVGLVPSEAGTLVRNNLSVLEKRAKDMTSGAATSSPSMSNSELENLLNEDLFDEERNILRMENKLMREILDEFKLD